VTPKYPYSWLTLSSTPTAAGFKPAVSLQQQFQLSPTISASGKISMPYGATLPNLDFHFTFRVPYFGISATPSFRNNDGIFKLTGNTVFSVGYDTFGADLIMEWADDEFLQGAKVNFGRAQAGMMASSKEAASFLFWAKLTENLGAGFRVSQIFHHYQSFWKVASSTSVGFRHSLKWGYLGFSWQEPKTIAIKLKYLPTPKYDLACMARVEDHNFSTPTFSFSLCLRPGMPQEKRLLD
jgi:hypothetical protein